MTDLLRILPAGHVAQSPHFVLVDAAGPEMRRELLARAERVYRHALRWSRDLGLPARPPPLKMRLLLFGEHAAYGAFRAQRGSSDDQVLGFYDPPLDCAVFFDLATYPPIARLQDELARRRAAADEPPRLRSHLRRQTERLLMTVVQHEIAHQVLERTGALGPHPPAWLAEGLAQMFELPFERGATLELGTNRYRLLEFLRLHADPAGLASEVRRLVGGPRAVPAGPDYSLSWAVTNYLYKRQRVPFAGWLRGLHAPAADGENDPQAALREFEARFGEVDAAFAAGLAEYVEQLAQREGLRPAEGAELP